MCCRLKHLAVAAAIVGLAAQVQAGYFPGSTDFEDIDLTTSDYWSDIGDATIETVATPAEGRATYRPSWFSTTNKVLSVDNDVATPIVCDLGGDSATAATIYADALVTGAPLANDASVPEVGPTDKILVYTRVNAAGTDTNLCVYAKETSGSTATNEFVLTKSIGKDEWHRIVIKADNGAYQVFCDDLDNPCSDGTASTFYPINAVAQGAASMSSVAFAGTGAVDDLILSDLIPELPITTLTWDTSFASVSYVVGNETNAVPAGANGSYEFQPAGAVTLIGNTGYRTVTTSGAAGSTVALAAPAGLAWFSADATGSGTGAANDPYTIPDYATLVAMQVAVANDASFRSAYYVQTANIALTAPWPGIGIQNGKDLVTSSTPSDVTQFEAGAFRGTYDGGNYTISGFQMIGVAGNPANNGEGLDYCGFFNSTYGATIKNLKIAYAGSLFAADTTASTKESGATFVGVAKDSMLTNLTTVAGTVSCSKGFGGIVGYLFGTTVDSCTNNVNMTSLAKNKCGGIAMICQQSGCAILNCQNNGTMTTGSSNGEFGGILGYTDTITISNCQNTAACKMFYHHGGTVTLKGVNKGNATVESYTGNATPDLNFAIVDGNVATFVADNALAAGNTYKVMHTATATYNFTAPGTIAFDTALATPTYAITADASLVLNDATENGVTTYTAALAVAQVNNGTKYASLQAAVDAASAGDTVTTLADCTISTSLSIAKNLTVHNDHTITGAVNYAICIGATVSFEGSGKIERGSNITGSAFCVGANETTRGAITAGTAGALTFDGLTVCGGNGGNLIKLENGTVTMNGGLLTGGLRGIKADADAGSYTSAIIINGGTITNCSAAAVMASAESANGTATVTINGGVISGVLDAKTGASGQNGTHTITIPGTSTAKFDRDQSTFCESGYETVLSDGWYVVQAQGYNDPEGRLIEDYAVISWLSNNGFTQAQIDALGNNAAGTDRLYYCYLLNLNFTVQDASAALSFTEITVSNRVSMTVQLVRKAPLAGRINGALYIYGANNLAAGFGRSPIPDESVEYFTGDPTFNLVTASNDTVTQTAVATMNTSVTANFFKATIEVPWVDNGEGGGDGGGDGGEEGN